MRVMSVLDGLWPTLTRTFDFINFYLNCDLNDKILDVILKQKATVRDLKEGIKNYYKVKNKRNPKTITSAINWNYVWKTYCLKFEDECLLDNKKPLRDYEIKNKSELTFYRKSSKKLN